MDLWEECRIWQAMMERWKWRIFMKVQLGKAEELSAMKKIDWLKDGVNVAVLSASMCCVYVLTLVRIVLDFKFQLPGVGLHSVHVALHVLLILFMSIFKLDEFLLKKTQKQTKTKALGPAHKNTQECNLLCQGSNGGENNWANVIWWFCFCIKTNSNINE